MSNACFVTSAKGAGKYKKLEDCGFNVDPQVFITSKTHPMKPKSFPRMCIVPQLTMRYQIFCEFINGILPAFFENNQYPALVGVVHAVNGMHYDEYTDPGGGDGKTPPVGGHNFAQMYFQSADPGTGKTEIALTCNALLRGHRAAALIAGDASKPGIFENTQVWAGMTIFIDDLVTEQRRSHRSDDSKSFSQLVRAIHDRCERHVFGKIREANSPLAYTSNEIINQNDEPMMQRLLLVVLKELTSRTSPNRPFRFIAIPPIRRSSTTRASSTRSRERIRCTRASSPSAGLPLAFCPICT